jgi:hypothetical protein
MTQSCSPKAGSAGIFFHQAALPTPYYYYHLVSRQTVDHPRRNLLFTEAG